MKRGAVCAVIQCGLPAVRVVSQRPRCEHHAQMLERVAHRLIEDKPLLDALARGGDCLACLGVPDRTGCPKHREDAQ